LRRWPEPIEQLHEILILRHHHNVRRSSGLEDCSAVRVQQPNAFDVDGVDSEAAGQPPRRDRW
jgi:hypothetical protein